MPLGRLALVAVMMVRTVSIEMPYLFNAVGFSSTRTAGSDAPPMVTWPTPEICDSFCARMLDAASYSSPRDMVSDVIPRIMIGASAGLTLRYVGLLGRPDGSRLRDALMAACTSRAAPSMSRDRSNCSVMRDEPSELDDVISVMPAMRPSERSSGVATVAAIVSGLAPGSEALTEMVGKSTCGSGDTGSNRNAAMPASATPMVSSAVATGRAMKVADRFMTGRPVDRRPVRCGRRAHCAQRGAHANRAGARPGRQTPDR